MYFECITRIKQRGEDNMKEKTINHVPFQEVLELKTLIDYTEGDVSSKILARRSNLSLSLMAFDKGEEVSSHIATGDAMVYVIEGKVKITICDNDAVEVKAGETIVMPANVPHSLEAIERFKMLLTVVNPS